MKTHSIVLRRTCWVVALSLLLPWLCGCFAGARKAQTPCSQAQILATGLLGPSKIIQTPSGRFLVAETGPEEPNHGRVSIVDGFGHRRTLLDGLPSARAYVGDFSGPNDVFLLNRTLCVPTGQGDETLPGPIQGTERANPSPASPIFSFVLAVELPEALKASTEGFAPTLSDHQTLKNGDALTLTNGAGESLMIRLVVDFPDQAPKPRPDLPDQVRHSHPYGIVADNAHLYVVDSGFNNRGQCERRKIRALDLAGGRMYWSVDSRGNIQPANLDGSGQQVLLTGQNDPRAPVLDVVGRKIYGLEAGGPSSTVRKRPSSFEGSGDLFS